MRKTRLYLDTSPIIMIEPDQDPRRKAITEEFFRIVAANPDEYELFVSPVTVDEMREDDAPEPQKAYANFRKTTNVTELPQNDVAENLAWIYVIEGVLTQTHIDDLTHVAYAVVAECDYVITWNMRHLANDQTVSRVNTVNTTENYGKIFIATPEFITGGKVYGK